MWKLVKSETNIQESTHKFPPYMEGKLANDQYELANLLNDYFTNGTINTTVNKSINNNTAINNLHSVYKQASPQIIMDPVTTKEIIEIINSLPMKSSSGYDGIP